MINKVIFRTSSLFSLKNYNDGHLNSRSYDCPMAYTLRSAILASVIQLEGVVKAESLFHKIKNAIIYIQKPENTMVNKLRLHMASNQYYENSTKNKDEIKTESPFTLGVREYIDVDNIIFYIDNSIPDIKMYLNNIEHIGNSESIVFLEKIEQVDLMERVLTKWTEEKDGDVEIQEMYDWNSKFIKFENVYLFSDKKTRINQIKTICSVKNIAV